MELAFFRIPLYIALVSPIEILQLGIRQLTRVVLLIQWICSFLLLCFTAARLQYTTHLPKGDPLNRGIDFYGQKLC